ncbi:DUF1963 domain-containing protein [Bordetella sp. BOR01]|uniref:DUF1963 domain-containing protein n=1 Tax=Bordetella sp. BOR01 TaxID=2854779 RepID=UPI001C4694DE|nr:DUF1963 domain-containing protein [Bordetella sp. BOR01]MBV7483431.1 DUF1963 domain-containing protein [Bordetella sp. BOR01]
MFDSPADAVQAMQKFFEPHRVELVAQALVPAIELRPVAGTAGDSGSTRLGGLPDLPAGAAWPRPPVPRDPEAIASRGNEDAAQEMRAHLQKNLPYAFIGQIDLEEARALGPIAAVLPERGRLLFFYDLSVGPWESGTRTAHVAWDDTPRAALRPLSMSADLAQAAANERREREAILVQYKQPLPGQPLGTNYDAPPKPMSLRAIVSTPAPASLEIEALPVLRAYYHGEPHDAAAEDFAGAYDAMRNDLGEAYPSPGWKRHRLLGSPLPEQDDPRYQAAVVMEFGKEFLDRETWQRERSRIDQLAQEWRLLLQVDLADWSGGGFGEGTVYFLIRERDLTARRFDQVVAVYQQT